jgi:multicomponent Na+:H+ antiporter subunit G
VLGILLVLGGTALATRSVGLSATLLLVAAFQVLTAPVGASLIGRAAHRTGQDVPTLLARDDLLRSRPPPAGRQEPGDGSP